MTAANSVRRTLFAFQVVERERHPQARICVSHIDSRGSRALVRGPTNSCDLFLREQQTIGNAMVCQNMIFESDGYCQ